MKHRYYISELEALRQYCKNLDDAILTCVDDLERREYVCGAFLNKLDDAFIILRSKGEKIIDDICEYY